MLRTRVARLALVWVLFAVIGGLIFSGLDHAWLPSGGERTAIADSSERDAERESQTRGALIVFDDNDLQVRYGEYSETEFTLALPRHTNANQVVVDWLVVGAQLPAGMALQPLEERRALVYGTPQFVERWCFTLAAQFELLPELGSSEPPSDLRRTSRPVCFFAAHNERLSYPQFSTSTRLDRAEKNRKYREKISFERSGRRTSVSVAWHNLPQSLQVETSNRRGYVKISGKPRDRDSHIIFGGNVSAENLPQLTKLWTAKDARRSHFDQIDRHTYRITAVYPDGETPAEFHKSLHVNRGEVVLATITYDKRPFYFNVFRARGEHNDARFITRLEPQPSGSEYLLDRNAAAPRTIQATGNFYLMLKLTTAAEGDIVTIWKQFALTIDAEREDESERRYRCPSGYYYDRFLRHCVQNRGNPCPRGTYYEPADNTCWVYPSARYCPSGYYFDHFLRRCVLDDYPRCPWNYRWYPFSNECLPNPYWCPLGFEYDWGSCKRKEQQCRRGWHYDYRVNRCLRNQHACSPGYVWDRSSQSCQRNRRDCGAGYHWSARLNRCVYHGNVHCRSGYRYNDRLRQCVRIGRARRCPHGEHWSQRRGHCVTNNRPTRRPTTRPTRAPTTRPTARPTRSPTARPTARPTRSPRRRPTARPTARPTRSPSRRPTARPTRAPTTRPTARPTRSPRRRPTARPTRAPTTRPTARPTRSPSRRPTARPTRAPTTRPTARPTRSPRRRPTARPTTRPTRAPTTRPTARPTRSPRRRPTARPTRTPTTRPTARPTRSPRRRPTARPTRSPSSRPTSSPSRRRRGVTENILPLSSVSRG